MGIKIVIRMPELEVEFEGSEEFVRDELRNFISDMANLRQGLAGKSEGSVELSGASGMEEEDATGIGVSSNGDEAVLGLANEIGVETADVIGAFAPSDEEPFVLVDKHYWSAFKSNTPSRGKNAVPPGSLVGTLMSLWFDQLGRGAPTREQVYGAADNSNIRDKNIGRSINNCPWLRLDGSEVLVNPAKIDRALDVARAFCLQEKISE